MHSKDRVGFAREMLMLFVRASPVGVHWIVLIQKTLDIDRHVCVDVLFVDTLRSKDTEILEQPKT